MRTIQPLLAASLALTLACSAENHHDDTAASAPPASSTAPKTSAAPSSAAPKPAAPAAVDRPLRDPQFDFAPGGPIDAEHLGDYHVAMTCAIDGEEVGTMTFELWDEAAPATVRNFLRLCDVGFYDGVSFHRVVRDFMVQGGDPTGTGMGDSPFGTIPAEFSDDPARAHHYGVLSMARSGGDPNSASCQFFVCSDDGPSVWQLDGQYTSFGQLTSGGATLEAIANVETLPDGRENSRPAKPVTIVRAEVVEGAAPSGETIERPAVQVDLGDEPERVVVQHVLIGFSGAPRVDAERSKEEAAALAQQVLEEARGGADFTELVRTRSDDTAPEDHPQPGVYRLLNEGVRARDAERRMYELSQEFQTDIAALEARQRAGEITEQEMQEQGMALQAAARTEAESSMWIERGRMVPAFCDVAFSLDVGEVGLAEYDAERSPFGWHVIKRLE